MRRKGDIDRNIDELTESIRRLAIEEQALRNEIEQKNKELKSKNKHLIEARNLRDKYLHRRNSQRSRVTKSVTAKTGQTIAIGDTVEICNSYTKFSTWPKVKAEKTRLREHGTCTNTTKIGLAWFSTLKREYTQENNSTIYILRRTVVKTPGERQSI